MQVGDIVFYKTRGGYLKYVVKKIIDDDLLVKSYKSKELNMIGKDEAITIDDFINVYNNEDIIE